MNVSVTLRIELEIHPNEKDWAEATEEQRQIYLQEELREHINANLEDVVDFPIEYTER